MSSSSYADSSSEAALAEKRREVFVRNLPFDATAEDLTELFQEIGPIKRSVVVSKDGVSRGFGFVKFALEEDAQTAIRELNGREVRGRRMVLETALNRGVHPENTAAAAAASGKSSNTSGNNRPNDSKTTSKPEAVRPVSKEAPSSSAGAGGGKAASDPAAIRRCGVVVFGVPQDIGKKAFRKHMRSVSKKAKVQVITQDNSIFPELDDVSMLGDVSGTSKPILVTAPTPEEAAAIVTALNGTKRLFEKLRELASASGEGDDNEGKEKEDEPEEEAEEGAGAKHSQGGRVVAVLLKNVTEKRLRKRKCRLILRNLSFQATEENIATKLMTFGPLTEVAIARVPVDTSSRQNDKSGHRRNKERNSDGAAQLKSRGFAFVTFLCEKDAMAAVENSSKLRICNREFALDFCESKDRHAAAATEPSSGGAGEESSAAVAAADQVAIAAADDEEDAQASSDSSDSDGDDSSSSSSSAEDEEEEEAEDEAEEDEDAAVYGADDDEEGEDGEAVLAEEEEEEEEEKSVPNKRAAVTQDVTEGCTVFVRDLPFDATDDDLKTVFRAFGKLRFAVFVKDKETGIHRGSAFVKFVDPAAAQRAIAAAVATSYSFNSYNNQKKLQLEKDKSAGKASSAYEVAEPLTVRGKACRVDLAIDRGLAQRLDEDRSAAAASKDRRNLYLSNEGLETGNVALESEMPEQDVDKRKRAHAEKRKKLQNPLFFVSATRLCVRNLKKTLTDKEFRDLCIAATAEGIRRRLVSAQDMEAQLMAQGLSARDRLPAQLVIPPLTTKVVASSLTPMGGVSIVGNTYQKSIRAKVMLDASRLRGGAAQSRGYGFVEFGHHGHALACLRQLNNNTDYLKFTASPSNQDASKRSRLIVEFSLENTRKVAILKKRLDNKRSHSSDGPKPKDDVDDGNNEGGADMDVDEDAAGGAMSGSKKNQAKGKGRGEAGPSTSGKNFKEKAGKRKAEGGGDDDAADEVSSGRDLKRPRQGASNNNFRGSNKHSRVNKKGGKR